MPLGLSTNFSFTVKYRKEKMLQIELARVLFSRANIVILDFTKYESDTEILDGLIFELRKQFTTIIVLTPWLTHLSNFD